MNEGEAELTVKEVEFLAAHKISIDEIYDGRFDSKTVREERADELGKPFILTSARCRKAGHRIRTRKGHCIQCDTARISFMRGESAEELVYIAGTLTGRLLKIGRTGNLELRERKLRSGYGGFRDWKILFVQFCFDAQRIEREIRQRTPGERVYAEYDNGKPQIASEMIRASYSDAIQAFSDVTKAVNLLERRRCDYPDYEFAVNIAQAAK